MIELINVSKKFRIFEDRSRDLKETAINWLRGKKRSFRDLWALKNINFTINQGETVGFIGENGSGKSTLLKLICGIYAPDEGEVRVKRKASALLELGVGFHPDLTGEENIYLNGSMLGFNRKTMRERFYEIVEFSELGDFIYSPIRTYSSGMVMRLGFSIAMCVDPDILLIDEVLAVGDEAFQKKCIHRLEEFKSKGKTILIVSHALDLIERFCNRVVLLHQGKIVADCKPKEGIEAYHRILQPRITETEEQTLYQEVKDEELIEERSFNSENFRIMEIHDSDFFASQLFFETFGHSPPKQPLNYVAFWKNSKESNKLEIIGFIHVEPYGEVGLVGGICIGKEWQGKGLEKILLSYLEKISEDKKALFLYTDHPELPEGSGYEKTHYPYLWVHWLKNLNPEEKNYLIESANKIGPF